MKTTARFLQVLVLLSFALPALPIAAEEVKTEHQGLEVSAT